MQDRGDGEMSNSPNKEKLIGMILLNQCHLISLSHEIINYGIN